ncbi:MAG: alpha-ketoacid dehydrogenase subunit beta [Rhodothalassiaceae bacterium]
MTRRLDIRSALNETLHAEMARDPRILVFGEDVSISVMGVTAGLHERFGPERVLDMPISEAAFIGMAVGAAACGLRPVVELMFADFAGVCFDQILNQAAKLRYITNGRVTVPLVIRTTIGAGDSSAAQHSQSLQHLFTSIAGLKCVLPASAADAGGLLRSAIADPDPVLFLEHKMLYDAAEEVPDGPLAPVPLGQARMVRKGSDLTIVAFSRMVSFALEAADLLACEGIEAELIDPRTSAPLDEAAILASVARTGRLMVVDEGAARCGLAQDIAALVASRGFHDLKAPVALVTPPHVPVPFAPTLEQAWLPSPADIMKAARELLS